LNAFTPVSMTHVLRSYEHYSSMDILYYSPFSFRACGNVSNGLAGRIKSLTELAHSMYKKRICSSVGANAEKIVLWWTNVTLQWQFLAFCV